MLMALLGILAGASGSEALLISASDGVLSAEADFTVSGSNLTIKLTNTSTYDVLVPSNVLTAIFFDLTGVGPLTPVSALLSGGSAVFYDPQGQPTGGNVGGEWAYNEGLAGLPYGAAQGISSTGLGIFGQPNFNGPNLSGPIALNGLNYGILSAGDNAITGNGGITGSEGLIKNEVTFTLGGLPSGFTEADLNLTNVSFQYGTALTEPNIEHRASVSAPATLTMFVLGLIMVGSIGQLRRIRASG
jgi:hypothetical protein